MDYDYIIGRNLQRIRNSHRLTLRTVAADLGYSAAKLSLWETGQYHFKVSDMFTLARYWGVTIVSLCVTDDFNPELNLFVIEPNVAGWRT